MDNVAPPPERSRSFLDPSVPEGYRRHLLGPVFAPWSAELVGRVGLAPGDAVLDVASGLGPVARAAARVVGPGGRVVASDISPAMLAAAAEHFAPEPGAAPIEYLECAAGAIESPDDAFDAVLCQQGIQFFPDQSAALAEMRRVAKPGGSVALASWAAEHPLALFGAMTDALAEIGTPEPYPGAFRPGTYALTGPALGALVSGAGLHDVRVELVTLDARWESADALVSAVHGTPFGPLVAAMPPDRQAELRARLMAKLGIEGDGPVAVPMTSNIVVGRA